MKVECKNNYKMDYSYLDNKEKEREIIRESITYKSK